MNFVIGTPTRCNQTVVRTESTREYRIIVTQIGKDLFAARDVVNVHRRTCAAAKAAGRYEKLTGVTKTKRAGTCLLIC